MAAEVAMFDAKPGGHNLVQQGALAPLGLSPGKRSLTEQLSIDHVTSSTLQPAAPAPTAMARALALAQLGVVHLAAIEDALAPAFQRAVAATDANAVKAIALQLLGQTARIVDAQTQIVVLVPQADGSRGAALASTAATDPFAPDAAKLVELTRAKAALDRTIAEKLPRLSTQLGPQMFGNELVTGRATEPPPRVREAFMLLAYEVSIVVQLLEAADDIQRLIQPADEMRGTSEQATEHAHRDALDLLERWKGRPINFLFLSRVLAKRGLWTTLQGARSTRGRSTNELKRAVAAQARETGATPDTGELWDAEQAHRALSYSTGDWAISDDDALKVYDMLAQAEPRARAALVKQLHRMGRLGALCENLPWGIVKQLWESISDPEASKLLEPFWTSKGGGASLGTKLKSAGHWYTDAINKFLDIATFGAKPRIDEMYDAREAGVVSDDAYYVGATKAIGRAALVAAAMTASGGLAGELTAGAAEGAGLGRAFTAVASGAAGGGVGNVAGHFVGDVYDQIADGKRGFDSLSDYGSSFREGAVFGGVVGAVGLAASRFLPKATRTIAQDAAATHPQLTQLLDAARSAGRNAGARVRMTLRDFLASIAPPTPGLRLAYAGHALPPRIAAAAPSSWVLVTIRPLQDLNAPMQTSRGIGDLAEVERVDLFDDYGADASYQDELADWRHEEQPPDRGHAGRDEIGLAEPQSDGTLSPRRVRHVRPQELEPELAGEAGVGPLHASRLDITRSPRHHVLPQEELAFFQERGFPGRTTDNFTIELNKLDHEIVHGGNQHLARRHWTEHDWNPKLMTRLWKAEAKLQRVKGPGAKLTRDEILLIVDQMRKRFGIAELPYIQYNAR